MTITPPEVPAMGRVPNVELMHTGEWPLSTGDETFTTQDLADVVAALECPAVRRPILKFGHTAQPAAGQPAIGFIDNVATAEEGRTLVGDYVGMPGWLTQQDADGQSVLASAYPDRSIEIIFDYVCTLGHTHPRYLRAVALLGTEEPAIGTIESLQDLGQLYGVAASAAPDADVRTVTIRTTGGTHMPKPRPVEVAASVTTEDVRRAFYASAMGAGWSKWIEEMQLGESPQLIVVDDEAGTRERVPVTIGDGDGQDAVSFGEAVPVVVRYEDSAEKPAAATVDPDTRRVLFASRRDSRPAPTAAQAAAEIAAASKIKRIVREEVEDETQSSAAAAAAATRTGGSGMDLVKIREALGLDPDTSDEEVKAAAAKAFAAPPAEKPEEEAAPVAASARADGTMIVDASAWQANQERIKRLEAAEAKRRIEEGDRLIAAAVADGKFLPNRKDHWKRLWEKDPEGTREALAGLSKNTIPVEAVGRTTGTKDDLDAEFEAEYAHLFPGGN